MHPSLTALVVDRTGAHPPTRPSSPDALVALCPIISSGASQRCTWHGREAALAADASRTWLALLLVPSNGSGGGSGDAAAAALVWPFDIPLAYWVHCCHGAGVGGILQTLGQVEVCRAERRRKGQRRAHRHGHSHADRICDCCCTARRGNFAISNGLRAVVPRLMRGKHN